VKNLVDQSLEDFSETGILSQARNFEYRPEQQTMACAVAEALCSESPLLVEAGTGVGKSLAYLIPAMRFALAHDRKAVISTHTINLQEQLFHKDIPAVSRALGEPIKAALLKGRANYLCKSRLNLAIQQAQDLFNQEETKQLYDLLAWSQNCGEGSLAELPSELEITRKVWAQICSENHVCTPRNCGSACPYQAARLRVAEAQLVVLNHTLFFGLLSIAEITQDEDGAPQEGFIFPGDFLILDEAHTIETVAAHQLGIALSEPELRYELLRLYNPRTKKGALRHYASPNLLRYIEDAQDAVELFFLAVREDMQLDEQQGSIRLRRPEWTTDILSAPLQTLEEEVKSISQLVDNDMSRAELLDIASRLIAFRAAVVAMIKMDDANYVYWVETSGEDRKYVHLRAALIDVSALLHQKLFSAKRGLILTSATLSSNGRDNMNYFMGRVGAHGARTLCIGSPFDFSKQMRIVVARSMLPPPPMSKDEEYLDALETWIARYLKETDGRAFVLFTSYSVMGSMAERMRPYCVEQGWPLLVQGESLDRRRMVEKFKEHIGSVLFGTESFWTGVDVPGEALSNVIITKIPFESPSNPLTEARCDRILERGGKPFFEYSLPEAVLKFRQGTGRLIRSKSDKGLIVLLDARITGKAYGAKFMYALPSDAPREFL